MRTSSKSLALGQYTFPGEKEADFSTWYQDEVEQLDKDIESRHNTELLEWESSHVEEDLNNTSLVAPTDGLYDLTIGDSEDKQSKVSFKTLVEGTDHH